MPAQENHVSRKGDLGFPGIVEWRAGSSAEVGRRLGRWRAIRGAQKAKGQVEGGERHLRDCQALSRQKDLRGLAGPGGS